MVIVTKLGLSSSKDCLHMPLGMGQSQNVGLRDFMYLASVFHKHLDAYYINFLTKIYIMLMSASNYDFLTTRFIRRFLMASKTPVWLTERVLILAEMGTNLG